MSAFPSTVRGLLRTRDPVHQGSRDRPCRDGRDHCRRLAASCRSVRAPCSRSTRAASAAARKSKKTHEIETIGESRIATRRTMMTKTKKTKNERPIAVAILAVRDVIKKLNAAKAQIQ